MSPLEFMQRPAALVPRPRLHLIRFHGGWHRTPDCVPTPAPLLGGETINTAKFIELAGPAASGHIALTPGIALSRRPRGKEFTEQYQRRNKREIGLYAPYFYDAMMVIALAMQRSASSDPAR